MGIFSRFASIVNANLSALLDKAEDPEKMVRLMIQEMEDTLVEVRTTTARILAEKKHSYSQLLDAQAQVQEWQQKAELALLKEREDLARAALQEKQHCQSHADILAQEHERIETHLNELKDEVQQLQEKLADARTRQKTIIMRKQAADTRLGVRIQLDSSKMDNTMARFEQYERRVVDVEAEIDEHKMNQDRRLKDEFAELASADAIDRELAVLKQQLKKKGV